MLSHPWAELVEVTVLFDVAFNYQLVDFIARVTIERYRIVDFPGMASCWSVSMAPHIAENTRAWFRFLSKQT